ncbi:hypothetical protein MBANPS3_001653 [Mucor bainieri]
MSLENIIAVPSQTVSDPTFDRRALDDIIFRAVHVPIAKCLVSTLQKCLNACRLYDKGSGGHTYLQGKLKFRGDIDELKYARDEVQASFAQVIAVSDEMYSKLSDMLYDILLLQESPRKHSLIKVLKQTMETVKKRRSFYDHLAVLWHTLNVATCNKSRSPTDSTYPEMCESRL